MAGGRPPVRALLPTPILLLLLLLLTCPDGVRAGNGRRGARTSPPPTVATSALSTTRRCPLLEPLVFTHSERRPDRTLIYHRILICPSEVTHLTNTADSFPLHCCSTADSHLASALVGVGVVVAALAAILVFACVTVLLEAACLVTTGLVLLTAAASIVSALFAN